MDNRSELAAIGVTANTFKPGDRVVVTGSLARNEGQRMYLLRLDRAADGFWYEQVGQSPKIRNHPDSGASGVMSDPRVGPPTRTDGPD